ncbi:MAG: phage holin family protein [bacterium]
MFKNEPNFKEKNNIPHLIKEIVNEFLNLTLKHISLIKFDIKHDIRVAISHILLGLLCIFMGFCGLIFLGFFFILMLTKALPLWLATLLVALLYFVISIILLAFAMNKINIEKF